MKQVTDKVQVNVPFRMLAEGMMDTFLTLNLNPEIGIDGLALDSYSVRDFRETALKFRDRGRRITVHGPFMDLSPASPDPAIREVSWRRFDQLMDIIDVLDPETVVCHAGYDQSRHYFMKEEWLEVSIGFWSGVAERFQNLGCRMMLENVYESGPEELLQLVRPLVPYHVGVCLDVGHMNVFSSMGLSVWLRDLGQVIGQLHLHDNVGDRDTHLPVGSGSIEFAPLFAFVQKNKPVVTLEPHDEADFYQSVSYIAEHYSHLL